MKVRFFLRAKTKKLNQRCTIYCQFQLEGENKRCSPFSTNLQISANYFQANSTDSWIASNYHNALYLNNKLKEIETKLSNIEKGILFLGLSLNYERVIHFYKTGDTIEPVKIPTLIEVLDELIEKKRKEKRQRSTLITYRTRKANLLRFLEVAEISKILISEFRYKHIEEFSEWLEDDRKFCKNTRNKHLYMVSQCLSFAVNKEYIKYNPIGRLFLDSDPAKEPNYLLPEERQRIANCKIKALEKCRDIAVFLMYTGFSYTDYLSLTSSAVYPLQNGSIFLRKQRQKSKIFSMPPLLLPDYNQAFFVLQKYKTIENLPRPDISDLNKELKILREVCEIETPLSTSTFRDTFASMMENERLVEQRILMQMLGHTNPRQLRNYATVTPERIFHELNRQTTKTNLLDFSAIPNPYK